MQELAYDSESCTVSEIRVCTQTRATTLSNPEAKQSRAQRHEEELDDSSRRVIFPILLQCPFIHSLNTFFLDSSFFSISILTLSCVHHFFFRSSQLSLSKPSTICELKFPYRVNGPLEVGVSKIFDRNNFFFATRNRKRKKDMFGRRRFPPIGRSRGRRGRGGRNNMLIMMMAMQLLGKIQRLPVKPPITPD